jgi:RNA polymerase sigma factor (sigma-70 family)
VRAGNRSGEVGVSAVMALTTGDVRPEQEPVAPVAPVAPWPDALVALYRERRVPMVRLAYLLTGDRAIAEEVVHDAFVAVHRNWAGVRDAPSYLRTTVVNRCRSWGRRHQRERGHPLPLAETAGLEADELWDALGRLSPRRRAAVVLRYWADLPDAEIAAALGCRPSTVRTVLHRALHDLRQEIER